MTAISTPSVGTRVTPFERTLLRASAAIEHYVALRLERRAGVESRRATSAQAAAVIARDAAQARGAIGILPR
jgi:hypothetical protein